jgi:hypothetical protein
VGENSNGLIRWAQDSLITSSQFLAHQQAVNAAFIHVRFRPLPPGVVCERWLNFNLPLSPSVPLIPDAYFEIAKEGSLYSMFLEVDLGTETSTVWTRKVELYLKLAIGGAFEHLFQKKRFRVLVLLHSERRLEAVRRTVARRTEKLFWFSTQDDLQREGLWNATWLRPSGEQRLPVLGGTDGT